ncbi:MAG: glycosyltransferase [Chitinivibrionales bacterium]|nr:glycosyltransferase [Chitinivibrionales bacterium]MBD3396580.1 glycosyltransferase [Chitinivibrionales bacterium]
MRARFGAHRILVHYPYQKGIVVGQGIPSGMVEIMPHPTVTPPARNSVSRERPDRRPLHLGCTGFVNVNYDYELLFETLLAIDEPWQFTWIGGIRREEDRALLERLERTVRERRWEDRFQITGWMSDDEQMDRLADIDVYLALFANRSTSGSLLMALSQARCIIATHLPLTGDLNAGDRVMLVVNRTQDDVVSAIRRVRADAALREELGAHALAYAQNHTYARMAQHTRDAYSAILENS